LGLNRFPPPARSYFTGLAPRGDAAPIGIDIGGLVFRLECADAGLQTTLRSRYLHFLEEDSATGFRVRLLDAAREHFVPPEKAPPDAGHPLSLGWDGEILLMQSFGFAGWVDLDQGTGELALARAEFEKAPWCVENFLRVCTAWRALSEGGVLLHAASIEKDELGYVFLGASGSGKSTLAAISRQGRVVSDDLSLVRRQAGRFVLSGTPFRGTYQGGRPLRGDFPIAGLFRIFQAPQNRVEACPRNHAVADLLAAAPFIVDQLDHGARILHNLKSLDAAHPLAYLYFNLSGDFWEVLPSA
jgi:hypothetical protein